MTLLKITHLKVKKMKRAWLEALITPTYDQSVFPRKIGASYELP